MKQNLMLKLIEQNTPEIVLCKIIGYFTGIRRVTFVSALIAGLITHLTLIILTPVCADPVLHLEWWKFLDYELYNVGRWASNLITFPRGYLVVPFLNIMTSIIFMALAAVLLGDLFKIKGRISAVILATSMTVSPVLANHLFYYATGAGMPTWLVPIIPIYIIYRSKKKPALNTLMAILFIILSLGICQSDICTITGLSVLMVILDLLRCEKGKEIWLKFFQSVLVTTIGAIIYYITWGFFVKIKGITTLYGGANSYGLINTLKTLPVSIKLIYSDFWGYFFNDSIINNFYWYREYFNAILIIAALACIAFVIYRAIREKKMWLYEVIHIAVLIAMIPPAFISIRFLVTDYNFYLIMATAFVLVIPFIFAIYELLDEGKLQTALKWTIVVSTVIIIWTHILSDNAGYLLLNQTSIQTKQLASRVLDRIENSKGYRSDMNVCFIGALTDNSYHLSSILSEMSPGSTFKQAGVWTGLWENSDGWGLYILHFCGVQLN